MTPSTRSKNIYILVLGCLTALSPFSIDMYLPAFQKIAEDFNSSVAQISLSLSSYFIGLSVGQLFYGPLLDRFGRKKPLYVGIGIYILATLGCLTAKDIDSLVALRFLQAIGGCAAQVAAFAMVRDLFTTKESSKVFSLLVLILGASPLLAPTIGGFLSTAYGWHSVFWALAGMALVILLLAKFFLPDSYEADQSVSLKPVPIFKNFVTVFKEPQFYTYTLASSAAFAGLFAYVAGSPVIYLEIFKIDPKTYSAIFAALSVGFIGSSQLNILLVRHFRNEDIFFWSLMGQVSVTSIFILGAINGWFGVLGTSIMLFLLLCTVGIANPNGAALALAPFSKNAGSASALMGFIQMGVGAIASTIVGLFTPTTIFPIVALFSASSICALLTLMVGRKRILKNVEVTEGEAPVGAH